MANYYFTSESWGSDYAPENWEEICSAANDLIDQYIAGNELDPELDADQIADWSGRLWESWITRGQLPAELKTKLKPETAYDELVSFVWNELDDGGKHDDAIAYDEEIFPGARNVRINFRRNHRELYRRLLAYCAANGLIVVSTLPATYETVVRVEI